MKIKSVISGTMALAAAVACSVVSAPLAHAGSPCYAGDVCVYDDVDFNGGMVSMYSDKPYPLLFNLTDSNFNDRASSWINNSDRDARWFYDINGGGATVCMNSHSWDNVAWWDNDEMSSVIIYTDQYAC